LPREKLLKIGKNAGTGRNSGAKWDLRGRKGVSRKIYPRINSSGHYVKVNRGLVQGNVTATCTTHVQSGVRLNQETGKCPDEPQGEP